MPKGDCFTVAWRLAIDADEDGCEMMVCHGLPVGRGVENEGKRFWHAWCEYEMDGQWWVLDYSNDLELFALRDLYYAIGQITPEHVWRYTLEEAMRVSLVEDTYGPWVEGWREMGI